MDNPHEQGTGAWYDWQATFAEGMASAAYGQGATLMGGSYAQTAAEYRRKASAAYAAERAAQTAAERS